VSNRPTAKIDLDISSKHAADTLAVHTYCSKTLAWRIDMLLAVLSLVSNDLELGMTSKPTVTLGKISQNISIMSNSQIFMWEL
jgi:hypothetical protein